MTLSLELERQRGRALQEERDEARAAQLAERRQLETLKAALEEARQARAEHERQLEARHRALRDEAQARLEEAEVSGARSETRCGQWGGGWAESCVRAGLGAAPTRKVESQSTPMGR